MYRRSTQRCFFLSLSSPSATAWKDIQYTILYPKTSRNNQNGISRPNGRWQRDACDYPCRFFLDVILDLRCTRSSARSNRFERFAMFSHQNIQHRHSIRSMSIRGQMKVRARCFSSLPRWRFEDEFHRSILLLSMCEKYPPRRAWWCFCYGSTMLIECKVESLANHATYRQLNLESFRQLGNEEDSVVFFLCVILFS